METAIKKAIEGGYKVEFYEKDGQQTMCASETLLDPTFWQTLGKQQGWQDSQIELPLKSHLEWSRQMHRFLDHIIEGKSIDEFFEQLLT